MKTFEDAVRDRGGVWPKRALSKGSIGVMLWLDSDGCIKTCTRTEFEECTRRLRNEPSWDDAPGWAVAKAQNGSGWWYWYEFVPRLSTATFRLSGGKAIYAGKGEVIGDWKQTLRLRPEEKMEDKPHLCDTCVSRETCEISKNWIEGKVHSCVGYACSPERCAHGEIPPAGTVCSLRFATTAEIVVTITYVGDGVVCYRDEKGIEYAAASNEVKLRPLQTERERLIDEAKNFLKKEITKKKCATPDDLVDWLHKEGMLKMPEDK